MLDCVPFGPGISANLPTYQYFQVLWEMMGTDIAITTWFFAHDIRKIALSAGPAFSASSSDDFRMRASRGTSRADRAWRRWRSFGFPRRSCALCDPVVLLLYVGVSQLTMGIMCRR
ncbi:unnamed protein product [Durusdinium trenchii]|uniref:Uncharacterized protein n=1 Tax=Durusdinium trenchii TaxID=1381693 RepID=A0ABP0NYF0_9DINO